MDETTKSSNIVQFPNIKLNAPPQSLEEIADQIAEYRIDFSDDISELLTNMVISELLRTGVNLADKKELVSSIILIQESIKALYLRACGIEHSLHEVADDFFDSEGFTLAEQDDTMD